MRRDTTAILVAAGSGERLGSDRPKALVELGGLSLVRRAADAVVRVGSVAHLVVVVPPGQPAGPFSEALAGLAPEPALVPGGARRRDSVRAGLEASRDEIVLVHDAARPFASRRLAERVLDAARREGAAVPGVPLPDTLARDAGGRVGAIVPREDVVAVQTPQAFRRELLLAAHDAAAPDWDAPDDGALVGALGHAVALVDGEPENVKITWPADLARAEARLGGGAGERPEAAIRVGLGWDVHPLVAGRPFVLAGVVLDPDLGPSGHSDGDPLCHAVADALLGATGLGDIGLLFPDDDPACAGLPGPVLLARTVARIAEAGWRPVQADAVVITDRPKIAPSRDAVREALAALLGVAVRDVSVKGKRTEGLGGLAGAAGVGCRAIVQVVRVAP